MKEIEPIDVWQNGTTKTAVKLQAQGTSTVFFAAHLMVITFYLRSRMWPFKNAENPDPRTTDDHFLMEIPVHDNENELKTLLTQTGAVEVHIVEKEAH